MSMPGYERVKMTDELARNVVFIGPDACLGYIRLNIV